MACLHGEGMSLFHTTTDLDLDDLFAEMRGGVSRPGGLTPEDFDSEDAYLEALMGEGGEDSGGVMNDDLTPEEREDAQAAAEELAMIAERMVKSGRARDLTAAYQLLENEQTRMILGEDAPIYMHRYDVTL